MTRKEQIEQAASDSYCDSWSFIQGAEWADANPIKDSDYENMMRVWSNYKNLNQALAVAKEALCYYAKLQGRIAHDFDGMESDKSRKALVEIEKILK